MGLPHVIEQLLTYTFNVSAALALINMAPVFLFDGQAALDSLLGLRGMWIYIYSIHHVISYLVTAFSQSGSDRRSIRQTHPVFNVSI